MQSCISQPSAMIQCLNTVQQSTYNSCVRLNWHRWPSINRHALKVTAPSGSPTVRTVHTVSLKLYFHMQMENKGGIGHSKCLITALFIHCSLHIHISGGLYVQQCIVIWVLLLLEKRECESGAKPDTVVFNRFSVIYGALSPRKHDSKCVSVSMGCHKVMLLNASSQSKSNMYRGRLDIR